MAISRPQEMNDSEQWLQAWLRGGGDASQIDTNALMANDQAGNPMITLRPGDRAYEQFSSYPKNADGSVSIPSNVWQEVTGIGQQVSPLTMLGPLAAAGGLLALGPLGLASGGIGGEALAGGAGDSTLLGGAGADALGGYVPTGLESPSIINGTGTMPSLEFGGGYTGGSVPVGGGMSIGTSTVPAASYAPSSSGLVSSINDVLGTKVTGGSLLSGALQAGLGAAGANTQANALEDVANQQSAIGGPFRDLLLNSYTNPEFNLWSQPGYADAFQNASDMAAKSVSASYGNPYGNPGAMGQISNQVMSNAFLPALSNYRGGLMQAGGMGLNTSGQASLMGAQQSGGGLDALGYGIGTALNPQLDWTKLFQGNGNNPLNITLGGTNYGGR